MISSPKGITTTGRLKYEEEERDILRSFEPLFKSGEVQIDFTDNGSLDALKRKVRLNNYHILHFSGHGSFNSDSGEGILLLENDITLKAEKVTAACFAEALLKDEHRIPLVLLSSCQTAQADFEKGMAGITGTLLNKDVPAVVSMGLSVSDKYATSFAAHFYRSMAEKESLPEAFAFARGRIKEEEGEFIQENNLNMIPMQWMIPNLYLTQELALIDWEQEIERLIPEDSRVIFANTTLERAEVKNDYFVGRREDFARILPVLNELTPVMLKGQGGIGKTTMARKLIQRLLASQPNRLAFKFNEEGDFSVASAQKELKDFCVNHTMEKTLNMLQYKGDDALEQVKFFLDEIARDFPAIFLFDNIETFQDFDSGEFSSHHTGVLEIIAHAARQEKSFTIITGRYPLKELDKELETFDLNDIDLNDFTRKSYNLELTNLTHQQVSFLFDKLGGNFRMLEFFHRAFSKEPENMKKVFEDIEALEGGMDTYAAKALAEMAEDLLFDSLWERAAPEEQELAKALFYFEIPVIDVAFSVLGFEDGFHERLRRLNELTLVQVFVDRETDLIFYNMTPLVKSLLERSGDVEEMGEEFHEKAGRYHYYMFKSVHEGRVGEGAAAFWQFNKARNGGRLDELGKILSEYYFNRSVYVLSMGICKAVEDISSKKIPWWCGNRIGMVGVRTGQYDMALHYFDSTLEALEKLSDPRVEDIENKGFILNNTSLVYRAQGDSVRALEYLEKSLKIRRDLGDKRGEGSVLNNIGQVYEARGDHTRTLEYLEMSLEVFREVRDKSGEGVAINNLSQVYGALGNYSKSFDYLKEALKISRELGDKNTENSILANFGSIYHIRGDSRKALEYLEKSLKICREVGSKNREGTTLGSIGTIYYTLGDPLKAREYLEESLKIHRDLGDKSGESLSLSNIGNIYNALGDSAKAIEYFEKSLKISRVI
ncbi:MAG: tetratricopeptide repeat protein, partial [bacterium]|nr:tetratricopeptide repeat protein [bacterium]